ncbi:MAG TPA: ATP-binding protein [Gammaproteobacteria bacterium]|nr:ATP-binding protein [Gammaproteobacteria bacterium]
MGHVQSELFALFDTLTPAEKIEPPAPIASLLRQPSTTLLVNISGGKDSDAMLRCLVERHEREGWRCRLTAIHADLGAMEWRESLPHCEAVCRELGVELAVVRHAKHDLLEGIEARMEQRPDAPPFPSAAARFCTAGWKRNVIDRWIRHHIGQDEACVCAMAFNRAIREMGGNRDRTDNTVWLAHESTDRA